MIIRTIYTTLPHPGPLPAGEGRGEGDGHECKNTFFKPQAPVLPNMKRKILITLLGLAWSATTLPVPATAVDLAQLVAETARWESGQSRVPLQDLEQLGREAVGNKRQRAKLEAELVKLLAPDTTFEAKRFACQQLSVIGSDVSVERIAKLFEDDQTVGIACLAFGLRPSSKADKVLLSALDTAKGGTRLQIISTLGDRRVGKAVKALDSLARAGDVATADIAIRALGQIANNAACKALAGLREHSSPPYGNSLADASLRCAGALAAASKRKAAATIYEELATPAQSAQVRRGAFKGLLATDSDHGEQRILKTICGSDAVLKPVAIAAVSSLRNQTASETFGAELPKLPTQEQVWLIDALAARRDAAARAAIMERLSSGEIGVRLAAAAALGPIGGATAVRPLASALAQATDADEIRALQSALGQLPADRDTEKAIIAVIKASREETRARLIAALPPRRAPEIIALLFEEAENHDEVVATAAFRVLAKAGTGENLSRLLKLYATLPNSELRSVVAGFVQQAVVATDDVSLRSKAVCDALEQTTSPAIRCALIELLPSVGDKRALKALLAAVNGTDAQQRDAAVHALSEWPDLAAWDASYSIYRKPLNEAYRSIMLRSLVRLAEDANSNPDDKLMARYRDLVIGARDAADLKQILGALGGAANPEALKLASAFLEKPGVKAEAEVAVKKISAALKAKSK